MTKLRTIDDVLQKLPSPQFHPLPAPIYIDTGWGRHGIGLAVESMKRHTTDEGWQIFDGLESAGYRLYGHALPNNETDLLRILYKEGKRQDACGVVVVQDKREWDVQPTCFREKAARFNDVGELAKRTDLFKLTILKDSHQRPAYHMESAQEIGCNAWIVYYHPRIVKHLAPYVRNEHLVRTYHSLDPDVVPPYRQIRHGCLLSGSVSNAYPLRLRLFRESHMLPGTKVLNHPGYHRNGCDTRNYLARLSRYKVAICTSSLYGYALRKIIEGVACGCVVVTDLPTDEVLPEIDNCIVRIPHEIPTRELGSLLQELYETYDAAKCQYYAGIAKSYYSFKEVGKRLAADIETLRKEYKHGA